MDVKIEVAPAAAHAEAVSPVVKTVMVVSVNKAFAQVERVASSSCPSIAGSSISAVSPDYINFGGLALAAA